MALNLREYSDCATYNFEKSKILLTRSVFRGQHHPAEMRDARKIVRDFRASRLLYGYGYLAFVATIRVLSGQWWRRIGVEALRWRVLL
jgi:hypothetical protein